MTHDDGLPPPPTPAPRPHVTPHDDLSLDTVKDSLGWTAGNAKDATAPWAKAMATASQQGGPLGAPPSFKPDGLNPLSPVESMFEQAVGGDPSLKGMLKGVGSGILTGIGHPISALTDQYQVSKMRDLQAQFLKKNDFWLRRLSEGLGEAKANMRALANLMDATSFDRGKLDQIMKRKKACGDGVRNQIDDALANAKTPEERAKLKAMKDDMDKWSAERDQRMKAEQPAIDAMNKKTDQFNAQLASQRGPMRAAADSDGPHNETGVDANGHPVIYATDHIMPGAVQYSAGIRNTLLRARAGMGM